MGETLSCRRCATWSCTATGRLVTLSGAGGCGKTTPALEVARMLEGTMPDGAALIDLTVVREPEAVALACCDALGLSSRTGRQLPS